MAVGDGLWLPPALAAEAAVPAGSADPASAAFGSLAALQAAREECERALAESKHEAARFEPVAARVQADLDVATARRATVLSVLNVASMTTERNAAREAAEVAGVKLLAQQQLVSTVAAVRDPALAALSDAELRAHTAQLRAALDAASTAITQRAIATSERSLCAACLGSSRSALLMPCRHMCLCAPCAEALPTPKRCPLCQEAVIDIVRTFG